MCVCAFAICGCPPTTIGPQSVCVTRVSWRACTCFLHDGVHVGGWVHQTERGYFEQQQQKIKYRKYTFYLHCKLHEGPTLDSRILCDNGNLAVLLNVTLSVLVAICQTIQYHRMGNRWGCCFWLSISHCETCHHISPMIVKKKKYLDIPYTHILRHSCLRHLTFTWVFPFSANWHSTPLHFSARYCHFYSLNLFNIISY